MNGNGLPQKQGLYNPNMEKDSCGVGFIANIKGKKSYYILKQGLEILKNLKHRGAVGADASTGDGSGIMFQIPHNFFKKEAERLGIALPEIGDYAVGVIFLPRQPNARLFCEGVLERVLREENQKLIGWRKVPINEEACGEFAKATRPAIMQIFIHRKDQDEGLFKRKLYVVRKRVENIIREEKKPYTESFYICSLSNSTIVYKGQILGYRLEDFYIDLLDESIETSIAVVHERYSTNTFPSWKLAQPFRYIAHNGEINTIRGNVNWMNAREGVMYSKLLQKDFHRILPVIEPRGSDSSALDNALEIFTVNGHPLENILMMLIPEAWENNTKIERNQRGFYEYHARVMEPWDGPATVAFCDGIKVGIKVDRNGLRPARYLVTKDDFVVMASETGVVDILPEMVIEKGCVEPGKIFLVDTKEGRILYDNEIKRLASTRKPFADWVMKNRMSLKDIWEPVEGQKMNCEILYKKQLVFGFTKEELEKVIAYMVDKGKEPIGSMGIDIPLAVLSERPQLLFNYFKQMFAQVTNPSIDSIREESIMSLVQFIGTHGKLLDEIETEKDNKYIRIEHPILKNDEIENIRRLNTRDFKAITIPIVFQADHEENGLKQALDYLCKRAEENVKRGYNILILSDRNEDMYNAPIPSLLALSAVHHYLVRKKLRTAVDLIVEAGDARDVMHIALLVGFGAKAVNPYMVFESIAYMVENNKYIENIKTFDEGCKNYINAICSGLLKILSRIGISTLQSYCGAQIFEAVGINQDVIDEYFSDTPAVLGGIGLNTISKEVLLRHTLAYRQFKGLDMGGEIYWNNKGEYHIFNPKTVKLLREASVDHDFSKYREYAYEANEKNQRIATIRGLMKFKNGKNIPIEEVEPVSDILKRFTISGMSFGSLSKECHETLAIAMNRIGATSNSGEGGENPSRYETRSGGENANSRVKQVASARFGVTTNYLVNCDEIQIKIAQGAKPGEGGHLPGNKVTAEIAKVRHSAPGIDLISPPPHHDIYSIEDLSQLIFDLKNVNPKAKISVKLVSRIGVGTVAAGVAKGHADKVLISGYDGGTGASPISSMKYVGLPWEIGLSETQQTLLLNDLRSRIIVQVDGKMRTGRDVAIAALLGAEEYGFATSALVALGCRMCRQCHLNKCSMGIATQEYNLRKRFKGRPEDLINYLKFVAQELRQIMAKLGFRKVDEMIGRADVLEIRKNDKYKIKQCDLSSILFKPELPSRVVGRCIMDQKHDLDNVLDKKLIENSLVAIERGIEVEHSLKIRNTDRSFGTMLSGEIAKRHGDNGLDEDTIVINALGSAGQSFGAFAVKGLTLILQGDANDYLGKGLSGGKIILFPHRKAIYSTDRNIIAGNTLLYGATAGEVYISGRVGQRFCVRNSGSVAVVEGIGDHGCEYMTGGIVIILGTTGKNFGAGMSGGEVYVLDENEEFRSKCNKEIVGIEILTDSRDIMKVKNLISKHYDYTRSLKAKRILEEWECYLKKFLKVTSQAYQKQLESIC
ncbi:glutamate synthase large subunit [Paramaledivibacter caminithermalis]|jgi:glutamate synthase (NADPH/NADH) large chain|uniref:Glutamate synthase (NADPH/NADH) large chain n=1 Tax=Paramaledivibacter caminithermalis (strain DSM 15212 / CIP 107654 / DViRD3) TaxID=1121301 RepID=A0A1M6SU25_PARC5|nr:glutamate synthase large subunit [Paramaledivibacter caminithermalis]SHK48199.1 glutamate synthase (NADPH/NADH) large chain [Paramaledivibacter caminithermalis DSM 15212]